MSLLALIFTVLFVLIGTALLLVFIYRQWKHEEEANAYWEEMDTLNWLEKAKRQSAQNQEDNQHDVRL